MICKYLRVSKDNFYKWIDKHGMPSHRTKTLWKFKKNESNRREVRAELPDGKAIAGKKI
ncbi:MAG: hypothetical protein CSA18_01435 [Deltaproteobacteria bacterium]|nr:MAG: hypothetical protein CSA18_01435 [Deltaproteobacteria bacterium]